MSRFFTFILFSLFINTGNAQPYKKLVADSVVKKFRIKQVSQDGFGDINLPYPYWTEIETFDTGGRIIQSIYINHRHHKFVEDFHYYKKGHRVKVTTHFYDWNPSRESNTNDTLITKDTKRYNISQEYLNKPKIPFRYRTKYSYDSKGRVICTIDSIKCGHKIVYFAYDTNGNSISQKYYSTHHNHTPDLVRIDSFIYSAAGVLVKTINYEGFNTVDGKLRYNTETETMLIYNDSGLLLERDITINSRTLSDSLPDKRKYSYKYLFF